jgi:D-alanyl-D-alanine carboxypeptidase
MNPHLAALGISSDFIARRGLRACEETQDLECAEVGEDGRKHLLVPAAARAWRSLKAAALADGVDIYIVSAFRSTERQAELIRQKLDAGETLAAVLTVCAPPGYSEHHTGRAVDISTPSCRALEMAFDQTAAYAWLTRYAPGYGFHLSYPAGNPWGFQYEPWHWCLAEHA